MTSKNFNISQETIFYSIIFLYFLINIFFLLIDDKTRIFSSTDPLDYINSATSLIKCKSFAYIEINCFPKTWNTPGYPFFIAIHKVIFENYIFFLVISQILLLLFTAVIGKKIMDDFYPKLSIWVFSLILFNPNSLSTAHLIQTETLFTFILMLMIYLFYKFQNLKSFIFIGFLSAVCAYVRPAFYYFCIISPFLFFIYLNFLYKINIRKSLMLSVSGGLISILLVALWVNRNNNLFDEKVFVSNTGFMVWINLIEMYRLNGKEHSLDKKFDKIMNQISNTNNYFYNGHQTPRSSKFLLEKAKEEMNFPKAYIITAAIKSLTNLFFSGGSTNFERLITGSQNTYMKKSDIYYGFKDNIKKFFILFFSLQSTPILFSILIKFLSIAGIFNLIIKKQLSLLFVIALPIFYLTPLYGFFGQSRFRVPMEPSFIIFAVIGASFIISRFLKIKQTIKTS